MVTGTVPDTIGCPSAERELVACLLTSSPADAARILARLDDDADLTVAACRIVVAAMRRLVAEQAPDLGPVAVFGELRRTGEIASTALGNGPGAASGWPPAQDRARACGAASASDCRYPPLPGGRERGARQRRRPR